jgi:type 1 glutamine amidotransferase
MAGRAVLVISSGVIHPSLGACRLFNSIVRRAEGAQPAFRRSTRSLRLLDASLHGSVALFLHLRSIEPEDLGALAGFVEQGGGLFALHGALASFKADPQWAVLIGAAFAGHESIAALAVHPDAEPGVFAGIEPFTVADELYRMRIIAPIVPRMVAVCGGTSEPVVWTRAQGSGRVCCCSLGHTRTSLRHPAVQQIVQRGIAWVSENGEANRGA